MERHITLFLFFLLLTDTFAQNAVSRRSTFYLFNGPSGANVREFNAMLEQKGLSSMRNGYTSNGIGYQAQVNDFDLGVELYHNNGPRSTFREYEVDYRTTRLFLNVGYSMIEEGGFNLMHYMSLGMGYMNFQMLKEAEFGNIEEFLANPEQGFILRKYNIHRGSQYFGGFLTEIGFQLGYDINIPGLEEALELVTKFGYAFSPFENAWNLNGISFDNIQSGAFVRFGAGITLTDKNMFYSDATLGVHFIYGQNFNSPEALNPFLENHGYSPLPDVRGNFGLKIIGENRRVMYGMEVMNLSTFNRANEDFTQTLNSVRVYGNLGLQLYKRKNLELGLLGGLGYGNLRYTLEKDGKPDFPLLFEEPDHDGTLVSRGLMMKPEVLIAYAMPLSSFKIFNLVYSIHAGYELPIGNYPLANLNMASFMRGPYLQFGLGFRP
ncbi:hypothetical protein [Pleomorphovibrio marinus]|uniref:hypothetical protein n=1 Tax=Pleomorphovibrio marinus TaxID=2164132 RepID=UPI000E0C4489|nr:hypothetical protein [Pleomorphovibrio marinus]